MREIVEGKLAHGRDDGVAGGDARHGADISEREASELQARVGVEAHSREVEPSTSAQPAHEEVLYGGLRKEIDGQLARHGPHTLEGKALSPASVRQRDVNRPIHSKAMARRHVVGGGGGGGGGREDHLSEMATCHVHRDGGKTCALVAEPLQARKHEAIDAAAIAHQAQPTKVTGGVLCRCS
jgi:hypothetical protein